MDLLIIHGGREKRGFFPENSTGPFVSRQGLGFTISGGAETMDPGFGKTPGRFQGPYFGSKFRERFRGISVPGRQGINPGEEIWGGNPKGGLKRGSPWGEKWGFFKKRGENLWEKKGVIDSKSPR